MRRKIYECECEVDANRIVYKIVTAADENEAMDKALEKVMHENVTPCDINPPCVLQVSCLGEATD